MSRNRKQLPPWGCSQDNHVPNCGHFGRSGAYLGRHDEDCENELNPGYECTCNPTAQSAGEKIKEAGL